MKRLSYFLSLLTAAWLMVACSSNTKQVPGANPPANGQAEFKAEPGQTTPLHFAHLIMEFKPVTSGDTVVAVYPFKNMSQETIRITQAATSCDCMRTTFTQGNIQPGMLGEVRVNFLTKGQKGRHEKIIAVVMENHDEPITLRLNGEILAAEGQ